MRWRRRLASAPYRCSSHGVHRAADVEVDGGGSRGSAALVEERRAVEDGDGAERAGDVGSAVARVGQGEERWARAGVPSRLALASVGRSEQGFARGGEDGGVRCGRGCDRARLEDVGEASAFDRVPGRGPFLDDPADGVHGGRVGRSLGSPRAVGAVRAEEEIERDGGRADFPDDGFEHLLSGGGSFVEGLCAARRGVRGGPSLFPEGRAGGAGPSRRRTGS